MARRKSLLGIVAYEVAQANKQAAKERAAAKKAAAAQQRRNARAQASQHVREAREYLAQMRKTGTPEQIQAAQELLNEWLEYRDRL
jgi:hypothetical protein